MLSLRLLAAVAAFLIAALVHASDVSPPVLPLVVRNPYLSIWLPGSRGMPWDRRAIFWTGQEVGLSLMVSVPKSNAIYPLLGRPQDSLDPEEGGYQIRFPKYLGNNFDSSATNFTYHIPAPSKDAKPATVVVSFLSPITPNSSLRQSIPASYVHVSVDGSFDVDVYMDINGDWLSGDNNNRITWNMQSIDFDDAKNKLWSWEIQREDELHFSEINDRGEWGRVHFTGPSDAKWEGGSAIDTRRKFAREGRLSNHKDENYRNIGDNEPVFAFHQSFKLGSGSNHASTLFTIAHIQDEIIQFASARGLTLMRPLWKSWFFSEWALLIFHYYDYKNAARQAHSYSSQLIEDATESGGPAYADILSLGARQVMGGTCFGGTPQNPLLFLKEISSDGNTQTVDVIFPSFPFFLYTNPRWLAYLLEPLLEHQLSGQYPNKYSMHDLGASYPNETGHADGKDEYMPVEECGDMLIMGLALVNSLRYKAADTAQSVWSAVTGSAPHVFNDDEKPLALQVSVGRDGDFGMDEQWGGASGGDRQAREWVKASYPIWKQWTEYLIEESLRPKNQLSTDDFAGWLPLQTNLALKGIVGIKAMSELSAIVGETKDQEYYKNISSTYIDKWQSYGLSRDHGHAKLAYDWYGSWTTLYSLYADAVLCFHTDSNDLAGSKSHQSQDRHHHQSPLTTDSSVSKNFIPSGVYLNQSHWYAQVMQKYGVPLDSRARLSKSDWEFQIAAISTGSLRRELYKRFARWIDETEVDLPLTDVFDTEPPGGFGNGIRFIARPVQGSLFSRLVLERACEGRAVAGFDFLEEL